MKLSEALNPKATKKAKYLSNKDIDACEWTPAEVAQAIKDVQSTAVFKELTSYIDYKPSPRALKNGTLTFNDVNPNWQQYAKWIADPLMVYSNGYVRMTTTSGGNPATGVMKGNEVEIFPDDLLKTYESLLGKLLRYVKNGKVRSEQQGKRESQKESLVAEVRELCKKAAANVHGFLDVPKDVKRFLYICGVPTKHMDVRADGAARVLADFHASSNAEKYRFKLPRMPVNLLSVSGDCWLQDMDLESLDGVPSEVAGRLQLSHNKISKVDKNLRAAEVDLSSNNLHNLKGIHKLVVTKDLDVAENPLQKSVLGVMLIPQLKKVHLDAMFGRGNSKMARIETLMNAHLPADNPHEGLLKVQSELLDMGMDAFADL